MPKPPVTLGIPHCARWGRIQCVELVIVMPVSEFILGMTRSYLALFQLINFSNAMPGMLYLGTMNHHRARAGACYAWVCNGVRA